MLSDRQAELKSAIEFIRPVSIDVICMLEMLPKLLKHPNDCRDQIIELGLSLADVKSRLMDLQESVRVSSFEPL
jgi:hypothetical protein